MIRVTEVSSGGMVFPSAWNMLDVTNTTPDATKLQAMICRYSTPIAMTSGSVENTAISCAAPK